MDNAVVEKIIEVLNEANKLDNEAISKLFQYRVLCNEELAAHPTIQVDPDKNLVGLMGIINGIAGVRPDGIGRIAMCVDPRDRITEFVMIPEDPQLVK